MPSSLSVQVAPLLQQHCRFAFLLTSIVPDGLENAPINRAAWSQAAMIAEQKATRTPWPQLVCTCAQALREIVSNAGEYCLSTNLTSLFLNEAIECVQTINLKHNIDSNEFYDVCFSLFECLAVMIRENCRKKSGSQLRPDQHTVMYFFETSRQWKKGDGNMVSDYYYTLLA